MAVTNLIEHLAMAPKSLTASTQTVGKIQKQEMAQAQTAEAFAAEVKKSGVQTVKSQKSEYKEYRYDKKDENHQGGQKRRHQEAEKSEVVDEDDVAAKIGRSFDIRI